MQHNYFLTLIDRYTLFLLSKDNEFSFTYTLIYSNKYSLYFLKLFNKYTDMLSTLRYLARTFDKFSIRELPFQFYDSFYYYYNCFFSFCLQADEICFYKLLYYAILLLMLFYLFSKLANYSNSYYLASYATMFRRERRWFMSDVSLMNLARISTVFSLASVLFFLSLLVFIGFFFGTLFFDSTLLFIYNLFKIPLPSTAGGYNFWFDTLHFNNKLNWLRSYEIKSNFLYAYEGVKQVSLRSPLNNVDLSHATIERFFIDPSKLPPGPSFFTKVFNALREYWNRPYRPSEISLAIMEFDNKYRLF